MALRFSRRLRIAPGLWLNLGKRGASVSAGVRGARVTLGADGTRATVGLPGTGLSYTATSRRQRAPTSSIVPAIVGLLVLYVLGYALLHVLGIVG